MEEIKNNQFTKKENNILNRLGLSDGIANDYKDYKEHLKKLKTDKFLALNKWQNDYFIMKVRIEKTQMPIVDDQTQAQIEKLEKQIKKLKAQQTNLLATLPTQEVERRRVVEVKPTVEGVKLITRVINQLTKQINKN